ncbi:MAG: DUF1549 domain-containing protein [Kofleriaceae bacterium]
MRRAWLLGLVVLGACGNDRMPDEVPVGLTCEEAPDPHCDHPIDRVLVPKLRALGLQPRDASHEEVCRRMAIDLLGRTPTPAERASCETRPFRETARAFMATDDFVRTQRRHWAELVEYESLLVWGKDLVDLDGVVAQLYREQLSYADFVRKVAVHPALFALHPGDSWTSIVFELFLGRPARQDELDGARSLLAPWAQTTFAGGDAFWGLYTFYRQRLNWSEESATETARIVSYNGQRVETLSNLCACTPSLLNVGCISEVFGTTVRLEPICVDATNPRSNVNVFRHSARTPSTDDLCGDNVTRRPECADRARLDNPVTVPPTMYTFGPYTQSFIEMTPAMRVEWNKIGDAIVARDDMWEAAVDRELRKLLGWWQATFKHPESDIPAVRAVLAQLLAEGATTVDLIELIVTSQLYVRPRAITEDVDASTLPPWAAGPSKLLAGEVWWASATGAVGETPGTCDFRFGQSNRYEPFWVDVRDVETTYGSIEQRYAGAPSSSVWGVAVGAIQRLGGCTGDSKRPEISNVGLAFSQAAIARELCAVATSVTPPGWSGDLAAAATHLIGRIWNRAAIAGEVDALVGEMQACIAAGSASGCSDAEVAARWACSRMIDSAEFSTY